jgi:acetolactate synthase I/II/III large subunit
VNGAEALARTLVANGVGVCFMNPGTSEMHLVAALDAVPELRGILGLFEGVATGAADGYARMAGHPAATLLHLGPGLGNGLANLHNARKAGRGVVNIVGDHATIHPAEATPLGSDIVTVARNVSTWIRTSAKPEDVGRDTTEAVAAAAGPPGSVATLILPADVSWSTGGEPGPVAPHRAALSVPDTRIAKVAGALRVREPAAMLLGGRACTAEGLAAAERISRATGARLFTETFPACVARGAGRAPVERLAYLAEMAEAQLSGVRRLILVDAGAPVSFFAYPGRASDLVPAGATVHELAGSAEDAAGALDRLAEAVGAGDGPEVLPAEPAGLPTGALTVPSVAAVLAALLPEGAIVSDESNTAGFLLYPATVAAAPHDWLALTGGAIGQGLPVAVGAAVACPDRPVIALEADGSALYTIQALWTMARESLDVTTILLANRSYAVLNMELDRVGAGTPGPRARDMLDLSRPDLDFVALARGLGVPATRAGSAEDLAAQLGAALAEPGPHLIEAVVPSLM